MARRLFAPSSDHPLLDLTSYARRGPERRDRFSPAELGLIARTVHRAPEVIVKVLTRSARDVRSVGRHLDYLSRKGELDIETDYGEHLQGKGVEKQLLDDWDLKLDEMRPSADLPVRQRRTPPKLVHKLIFSMPEGTPELKVLEAVRNLAREEFALKHRYAMVLHTDEPHPHVHVVVKAMGYDGTRLNIRKATLRHWRREFARHLRELGVEANATDRAVRGASWPQKSDGIYRAALRDDSTHWQERTEAVARELAEGELKLEPGAARLRQTRREVVRGWSKVADQLLIEGHVELAHAVRRFIAKMPPPLSEKEFIAKRLEEPRGARSRGLTR